MRVCQAKKVGLSGRRGFSCWPKQTLNTFTIGGFFRPEGWEALLAKKKEEVGNLDLSSPFLQREWVQGLSSLPFAGLCLPPSKG